MNPIKYTGCSIILLMLLVGCGRKAPLFMPQPVNPPVHAESSKP